MPTACTATMVTGNGDNEGKLYGAASDYLKKIPSNLRGLAIRNVNKDTFTSKAPKPQYRKGSGDVATEESIMAELGDDGDDLFDQAMDVLELEDVDVSKFDGVKTSVSPSRSPLIAKKMAWSSCGCASQFHN